MRLKAAQTFESELISSGEKIFPHLLRSLAQTAVLLITNAHLSKALRRKIVPMSA